MNITCARIREREITVVFFLESNCGKADNSGAVYRSHLTEMNKKMLGFGFLVPQKLLKGVGSTLLQFYVFDFCAGMAPHSLAIYFLYLSLNSGGINNFPSNIIQIYFISFKYIQVN